MEVDELRKRYAAGRRDFSWADLRNANLTGIDLPGIQLYHANLSGANLTRANLSKSDLRRAILTGANLTGTNLIAANLARAHLEQATVTATLFLDAILPNGEHWKSVRIPNDLSTSPVVQQQLVAAQWSPQRLSRQLRQTRYLTQGTKPHVLKPPLSFWQWGSIAALAIGYGLLGLLLSLHEAPMLFWSLTWLSSLLWGLTARSRWFVPLGAALAVLLSVGISPWVLGAAIAVALLLFGVFYYKRHHPLSASLQEALWGAGLVMIVGSSIAWIVAMPEANLSGWLLQVPWLQQSLLLLGSLGVGLGSFSWSALEHNGLTKVQRFSTFAVVTLLGLLIGSAGPTLL